MFNFQNQTLVKPVSCLNVTKVKEQGNRLELKCNIAPNTNPMLSTESTQYSINADISFQIKVIFVTERQKIERKNTYGNSGYGTPDKNPDIILVLFKFIKKSRTENLLYSVSCNSINLGLSNKTYVTDNDSWYLVYEAKSTNLDFHIVLTSKLIVRDNPFKSLYDDEELTDLKLVADEESTVNIHSAVLASQSAVVRKKMNEKTIKDGILEFKGIHGDTLKHFKDYIYLKVLPNDKLEELLLIASENAMHEMKYKCISKILGSVTAKNYRYFTEYAQKHKIFELYLNLLECIQMGEIEVADLKKYYNEN